MLNWYRPAAAAVLAASALAVSSPAREQPKKADPVKRVSVMQRKLALAQKVLEGLALEDFDKLGDGADGLIDCVKDATWRINDSDKYSLFSNEFLAKVEALKKAAKAKKIDAAALAYVDMTLTCVKCHQYLRAEGMTLAPAFAPPAARVATATVPAAE